MKRRLAQVATLGVVLLALTGCVRPYDKPVFKVVEASQTAFLIPLTGDTTQQKGFDSEAFLEKAKVATKEIQIPHRWVQTGRMDWDGEYRDTVKLIVVERKPETREWTSDTSGTDKSNQGLAAQSKEAISFKANMNISAQIDESDATKFLYRYNNKPLAQILDFEIRARIESIFVEVCSKMTIDEIRNSKEQIMNQIRNDVMPYFKERGINITSLGLKGNFTYDDPAIQASINKVFSSLQDSIAQENINKTKVSAAKADAEAAKEKAKGDADANEILLKSLTSDLLEYQRIQKWDGKVPQIQGGDVSPIIKMGE